MFAFMSSMHMCAYMSTHMSIHMIVLMSSHTSAYMSTHMSIHLFIDIDLFITCMYTCLLHVYTHVPGQVHTQGTVVHSQDKEARQSKGTIDNFAQCLDTIVGSSVWTCV